MKRPDFTRLFSWLLRWVITSGQLGPRSYEQMAKGGACERAAFCHFLIGQSGNGIHMEERGRISMQKQIHLSELAGVDITAVNKEDLVDVSGLAFDNTVPKEQRAAQVLRKVKNPYCFRVGDMGVKLEFLDSAPPLEDCFTDFLQRKKSGL